MVLAGSSPRTRGTDRKGEEGCPVLRFIPADAGNSSRRGGSTANTSVHPRGRGEQLLPKNAAHECRGSSPRTRGTDLAARYPRLRFGFIPADAGNSTRAANTTAIYAVHPRGRGEQSPFRHSRRMITGSSPRTRGTGDPGHGFVVRYRFIPADAGNRQTRRKGWVLETVHPRGRGEQQNLTMEDVERYGSSPRTRGTDLCPVRDPARPRFIPADAGNSSRARKSSAPIAVHPRGRGEQSSISGSAMSAPGSSPRTRGTVELPPICRNV